MASSHLWISVASLSIALKLNIGSSFSLPDIYAEYTLFHRQWPSMGRKQQQLGKMTLPGESYAFSETKTTLYEQFFVCFKNAPACKQYCTVKGQLVQKLEWQI